MPRFFLKVSGLIFVTEQRSFVDRLWLSLLRCKVSIEGGVNMKTWVLGLATVFFGIGAQAQIASEYLFQAPQGQSYVEVKLNENSLRYRGVGGSPIPIQLRNYSVNYEWGMTEQIAIYGSVLYSSSVFEGFHSGFGPLQLGTKFAQEIGPGLFFSKLNIAANVIEGKLDCNGSGKCNVSDSSISADIQLAYRWSLTNAFTGFSLNYGIFSTDMEAEGGSSNDKKGYLTLSAFYERAINENLWGLALSYISQGGFMGTSDAYPYSGNNIIVDSETFIFDVYALSAYLRAALGEKTHLITEVEYSRVLNQRDSFITSNSQNVAFNLTFRRMF